MADESIGQKLAALRGIGDDPLRPEALGLLKKSLADRSSRVVQRAAELIGDAEVAELLDDLLPAFRRLLADPVKSDPGCGGKTAIVRALVRLEYQDADFYRAGIVYHQFEPAWGGEVDTAGELRGTSATGLVNCATSFEVLNRCAVLLTDERIEARMGAAHAIGVLGHAEGAALLRLKSLLGDDKAEVIGACCAGLIRLDRDEGVEFVSQFLRSANPDVCIQAALALAESRRPGIFSLLRTAWKKQPDSSARESLLVCIGLVRSHEAFEFLLSLIDRKNLRTAAQAIKLLKTHGSTAELRERVASAVAAIDSPDLSAALAKHWPQQDRA